MPTLHGGGGGVLLINTKLKKNLSEEFMAHIAVFILRVLYEEYIIDYIIY
jgi:hypothetical protein